MGSRVPHFSLLAKFSVLTFLCVAALGAALAILLREQILDHAARDARELAAETAHELADKHLTPADLEAGLTDEKLAAIDRNIQVLLLRGTISDAKLFNPDGRLVYSVDRREIGTRVEGEVRQALAGRTVAGFEEDSDGDRLYEVYTPLRFVGSSSPSGAFELYLPYEPIAA